MSMQPDRECVYPPCFFNVLRWVIVPIKPRRKPPFFLRGTRSQRRNSIQRDSGYSQNESRFKNFGGKFSNKTRSPKVDRLWNSECNS